MLTTVLPGIRELRAPLSAGYIWLLNLWLLFGSQIPARERATGLVAALYQVGGIIGPVGLGIVGSFIAYLIGSLSQALFDKPLRRAAAVLRRGARKEWFEMELTSGEGLLPFLSSEKVPDLAPSRGRISFHGIEAIRAVVSQSINESIELLSHFPDPNAALQQVIYEIRPKVWASEPGLVARVISELDLIATRLIGDQPELFSAVDRFRGESEFRLGVVPPLLTLFCTLALELNWFWSLSLLALAALYVEAIRTGEKAGDLLADALLIGRVEAPVLERVKAGAMQKQKEEDQYQ